MITRLAILAVLSLALGGCMSSVRVSQSTSLASPPKGIPFYAKTGACKQETAWLEPQYIVTYESKIGASSFGPVDKVLNRQQFMKPAVQGFLVAPQASADWQKIIFAEPGPDVVNETNPSDIKKEVDEGNWTEASNTAEVDAVVDYGNVFYLNSARPLAGTTQVDAKLSADGTLTEGSAQVNDQTIATVASAISSLVTSATTAAKFVESQGTSDNTITVKTKVYKHTHSQYLPPVDASTKAATATPSACIASPSGVVGGSFVVTEATDSTNAKPATTDKDNTISVSGSIVLPKTSAAPSPTAPSGGTPTTPPAPKKP